MRERQIEKEKEKNEGINGAFGMQRVNERGRKGESEREKERGRMRV